MKLTNTLDHINNRVCGSTGILLYLSTFWEAYALLFLILYLLDTIPGWRGWKNGMAE